MAKTNNKAGLFLGVFAGVGLVAIVGFIYLFNKAGTDLEERFAEVEEALEEIEQNKEREETVENQNVIETPPDVAAIPADATVTEEGVGIKFLAEGDGVNFPTLADDVTIHYTGWTTEGELFDSSVLRGDPATFPLSRLIPGWQVALPKMSKGSKARIWIPVELAYNNQPGAPAGMLVFDIELFDFGQPGAGG